MSDTPSPCPHCGSARGPFGSTFLCGSKECEDGKVARSTRCERRQRYNLANEIKSLERELAEAHTRIKELVDARDALAAQVKLDAYACILMRRGDVCVIGRRL